MADPPIAMRKELTFYPETERTRDLVYSEQSSCDRSIHLLLQDNSVIPYEFLLKAYREVVARYLSSAKIDLPSAFLKELVLRIEELSRESNLDLDDFGGLGFHLLLRSPDAVHLLTLSERDVHVCSGGEMISLAGEEMPGVERIRTVDEDLQKELFPQRLRDLFVLLRLKPGQVQDKDIVLGCGEQEKGTVLETLSNPTWSELGEAGSHRTPRSVKSKFISRRILAVRFEAPPIPAEPIIESPDYGWGARAKGRKSRRGMVAGFAVVAVVVLNGVLWIGDGVLPGGGSGTDSQPPAVSGVYSETERIDAPVPEPAADEEDRILLAEDWRNTYEDQVTSSPVVHQDKVIFGCRDGNVYALDRRSGETLWRFSASAGVGASPAVYKDNVIAADYNGNVYSVDVATGRQLWNRKLPMKVVSSPRVSNHRVLIGCYDGYAYCLSAADGGILWKCKTRGRIRASSVAPGDLFVVPSYDGHVYALAGATGKIEWRANLGGGLAGTPAARADTIVVGAPDGTVCAMGAGNGSRTWNYATGAAVKSGIAIASGGVYVGSNDWHVYCLNLADGSLVWKYKTSDVVLSKPCVRDGVVYVGSYDGSIYALDAATGTLLDKFDTGGAIYSSPVADDEHLYFGTNRGDFICLTYHARKSS